MPLELSQALIRKKSITPFDEGCLDLIAQRLGNMGFTCARFDRGKTSNLFAKIGSQKPHIAFVGHTDVVPPGFGWSVDPFEAVVKDDILYGRGTNDMKAAIACFIEAARNALQNPLTGSISFLLTSDEEGDGRDGMRYMLEHINDNIDICVIGEPTSVKSVGDTVKIGSMGSLNAAIKVKGKAGHVGYPEYANNPIDKMLSILDNLKAHQFDQGTEFFKPTHLNITSIDVGNMATNVIPPEITARFNVRFNTLHQGESLIKDLQNIVGADAEWNIGGEPYVKDISPFKSIIQAAIFATTGLTPSFSTAGGTSDGRFLPWPCFELGLYVDQAHKTDESAPIKDLSILKSIYFNFIVALLKNQ